MARKVITETICDITGAPAVDTVEFSVRGVAYRIDLSAEAVADFDIAVAGFIESAENLGKMVSTRIGNRRGTPAVDIRGNRELTQKIREWAREAGKQVSDRGRISAEVKAEFNAAHPALASVG